MSKVAIDTFAPDFQLMDYLGQSTVKLSAFRGSKRVFLVFNRGFL